ncbi:hypothetical protein P3S68_019121 [Capsicum galapagoense]
MYKAYQENFKSCTPSSDVSPLTSGNNVITLTSPWKKWYIRRIGKHCEKGVKLAITVLAAELGALASSPLSLSGPASWISPNFKFIVMVFAAFAMFVMIMT